MVKGREDLQRKKGEELFSLSPLEWLLKAIIACEQSLSEISSLDLGRGGGISGRQCSPTPTTQAKNSGSKEPRECLPCGFNHVMGNDIKRPLREIFVITPFFYCFSQKELSELREHLTGEKVSTFVIVRSS